jgi:hypothetical protein
LSALQHTSAAAALTCALLAATGCGGSSGGKSSQSSSTRPSTSTSTAATSTAPSTSTTPPAPAASASAGSGHKASASAGGVTATLRASTHQPTVGKPWPIHFTVLRGGQAVGASVSYEYLFAGQVVARRSHYTFHGRFSDVFIWPSSAVGYPLTFRAVIVSQGATINLDYPVQVSG